VEYLELLLKLRRVGKQLRRVVEGIEKKRNVDVFTLQKIYRSLVELDALPLTRELVDKFRKVYVVREIIGLATASVDTTCRIPEQLVTGIEKAKNIFRDLKNVVVKPEDTVKLIQAYREFTQKFSPLYKESRKILKLCEDVKRKLVGE